jgi:uncharacterized membrane protein
VWKYLRHGWTRVKDKFGLKVYIFIAIGIYSIFYSALSLTIFHSFRIYTWDLGIFNQALWTTLNGRLLHYTAEPFYTSTGCFLGAHFAPILLLIVPLYAILPQPGTLLVISTLIVAAGAIPAYEIARFFLKKEKAAALLGLAYLVYLPLQGVTFSGFSLEAIAVTLFLFIILFLLKGDLKKLSLALILGLATHESSAIVVAFIGFYGMWYYKSPKNRGWKMSLIISVVSIVYFVFAQRMRVFFGWTQRPSLWNEWQLIGVESPADLPTGILMNPIGAWSSLAYQWQTKAVFLAALFAPFAFLPLCGFPGLLPAVPYLGMSLLSSYGLYYNVESHYGAFIAPFFFVAMVHGTMRIQKVRRFRPSVLKLAALTLLLSSASLLSFLPAHYTTPGSSEHDKIVHNFMAQIPQNASVLTQSNIFPHLSSRMHAYTIPPPLWAEEYRQVGEEILHNLSTVQIEYVLVDLNSEPYSATAGELILTDFVFRSRRFNLIGNEDGVMLYRLQG